MPRPPTGWVQSCGDARITDNVNAIVPNFGRHLRKGEIH